MKLVDNWRAVLLRAWSVRFVLLSALADFAGTFGPTVLGVAPPEWAGGLTVVFLILAIVSRIVEQKALRK